MQIIFSIIHELLKEKNSTGTNVNWRNDLLNLGDEKTYSTVASALNAIGNEDNRVLRGVFSDNNRGGNIPQSSLDFFDKIQNNQDESVLAQEFIKLSKISVEEIKTQIIEPASYKMSTGGYLLFTLHKSTNGKYFFSCMMIKKQNGVAIDENLNITDSIYINLQKLMQSFSLNLSKYSNNEDTEDETYLKFIGNNKSSEPSSDYFIKAFGCEVGSKAGVVTKGLINAVKDFNNKLSGEHEWFKPFKDSIKSTILDYLSNIGLNENAELDSIKLRLKNALSDISLSNSNPENFFDEKVDEFINDLQKDKDEGGYGLPNSFPVSSSVVNQYNRAKIGNKSSDWYLEFNMTLFGYTSDSPIFLDKENGRISIKISENDIENIEKKHNR